MEQISGSNLLMVKTENSKIGSQLIFHHVAVTLPVVSRTHFCIPQTQVAIAPDYGAFDLVVDQS